MDLAAYVKAGTADAEFVASCATEAAQLVGTAIGTAEVPAEIKTRAVLEVGADLFHRRSTRNGVAAFGGDGDPAPLRVRNDPMTAARPLLLPYIGPGLG